MTRRLLLGLLLLAALGVPTVARAAIAVDGTATGGAAGGTSLTYAHRVRSNTNGLLVVWVGYARTDPGVVSGLTYNGVAMTAACAQQETGTFRVHPWYLLAPATGTNNVVITYTYPDREVAFHETCQRIWAEERDRER